MIKRTSESTLNQGLAVALGAVAGALATAFGAYLTAQTSEKIQKKQARRDAYASFLHEVAAFKNHLHTLERFLSSQGVSRSREEMTEAEEKARELSPHLASLQRQTITTSLAGPDRLASYAKSITLSLAQIYAALESKAAENAHDSGKDLARMQRINALHTKVTRDAEEFEGYARGQL
ncbi:hypothetical protein ACFVT2_41170 [Streptomyces sp. NPDC058000]|uniref:hypothetical protein n=1 Tax=Streptomyces sp. NPDC058000 TaxID=3346299 RepID=UPI0036E3F11D